MAGSDSAEDEEAEQGTEQAEPAQNSPSEGADEGADSAGSTDDAASDEELPDIDPEEQAQVPDSLADIDPDEVEAEAGAGADDSDESGDESDDTGDEGESAADAMEPDVGGDSPVQAGEMYVSVVQSVTNAQIRNHGGPEASELDRDHFAQYDLADHFDATMDEMGVGSDLDPHEALLLATVLSVGDGLVTETDVLDQQIDRLVSKAMGGDGGEPA